MFPVNKFVAPPVFREKELVFVGEFDVICLKGHNVLALS